MDANVVSFSLIGGIVILLLVCLSVYWIVYLQSNSSRYPPTYKGYIPWIGCAVEFGVAPLEFIEQMRKQLGPVYTLYVAGQRLTFITEADDFKHFFQSDCVDFQKAFADPVRNVASVSRDSFMKYHTKMHDMVKGRLASSKLFNFSDKLCNEFNSQLNDVQEGSYSLHELVRRTMYCSVMNNLFGPGVLPTEDKEKFAELEKNFVLFDELFEYGTKLPPIFIRDWAKSKWWLIDMFKGVSKKILASKKTGEETLLQTLLQLVDEKHAPNYSLLLLWASLANAIPITFWTLAFIFNNNQVKEKLLKEVQSTLDGDKNVTEEHIRKMTYLKCCVYEAIRMRATGIISRGVIKSFTFKNVEIPAGDLLMLSPFWAHRNPKFFPDPETYKPERWMDAELEKNILLDGFVAFGGGRYQCPGRWYAILEISMYVAMFLQMFDTTLITQGVPPPSPKHLVGTQQPADVCKVNIARRTNI